MSRWILLVEPDKSGRAMMDRVLTADGYATEDFDSAWDARLLLDEGAFDLAIVDEFGADSAALEEVRFLRAHYPRLPLIVMGTLLTAQVLLELLRMGVYDALPKPFTPVELRASVTRVLARLTPRHEESLEYAAALALGVAELNAGRLDRAARALARAHAVAPLDPEPMALSARLAELEGRTSDADRGYRAALALKDDEDGEFPDPYEGLARLAALRAPKEVVKP